MYQERRSKALGVSQKCMWCVFLGLDLQDAVRYISEDSLIAFESLQNNSNTGRLKSLILVSYE